MYVCMYVCMCVCVCMYMYVCVCVCVYVCVYDSVGTVGKHDFFGEEAILGYPVHDFTVVTESEYAG